MGGSRVMALRYDGHCVTCGTPIGKGERAYWDADAKVVYCLRHQPEAYPAADRTPAHATSPDAPLRPPVEISALDLGEAGRSASREYERRVKRREERVRSRHPRIGGLLLALSDEPQSVTAWDHGARGERAVGKRLDGLASSGVVTLHDRRMPRSRANIDHISIGPTGIYVIDSKFRESGRVVLRRSGTIFRPGPPQLWVGRRNCTPLVAKMANQVDAVTRALDGLPEATNVIVRPVLAFVNAQWGPFDPPIDISDVLVVWPKELAKVIGRPGPLGAEVVRRMAERLASRLKPA